MFTSLEEVNRRLRSTGYIADSVAVTTVCTWMQDFQKPLLLEGPAGSGKTQLAYAVAGAANTAVQRLQCYEGINEDKVIGQIRRSLAKPLRCAQSQDRQSSIGLRLANRVTQPGLHDRRAANARFAVDKASCVLLIDEIDKVDQQFRGPYLSQLLSEWRL